MNLPGCPLHPHSTVWKDGFYGNPPRQRYRCFPTPGVRHEWHKFTEPLPRVRVVGSSCEECERPVASHEGPPAPRWHEFSVRQIADVLQDVGRGTSYRRAGFYARLERGRVRANARHRSKEGTLAAGLVEVFAPVVFDELDNHTRWPNVVELDAQPIVIKTGGRGGKPAFTILAARGRREPWDSSEMWGLWANHQEWTQHWMRFLRSRPGRPKWLVTDFSAKILGAVGKVWGPNPPVIWLCEDHVKKNLEDVLKKASVPAAHPLRQNHGWAFRKPTAWDVYRQDMRAYGNHKLVKWLDKQVPLTGRTREEQLTWQAANRDKVMRARLPVTTGGLERELGLLRARFKGRQHAFRNQERTNRMLQLVLLDRNDIGIASHYRRILREHLDANHGFSATRRKTLNEPAGHHSLRP
jgi:hypothetical protein